jgi:ABC-2 type transport system ATP-binding protein
VSCSIRIRGVSKAFGATRALHSISLTIEPGLFGLLGPNGAGKTTLMRILVGQLAPNSGHVLVGGIDVVAQPVAVQRQLGYLPQDFGFYPHLTGVQMLAHLVDLKGIACGRSARLVAEHALARVGLDGAGRRRVRDYSGGMRQRLGIAQALVGEPAILVLDEPSSGLDPSERDRFHRVLVELAQGCTIVLSTHYVEDVANLCRRFALLAKGRVVAETTPDAACAELAGRVFEGAWPENSPLELPPGQSVTQSFFVQGVHRLRIVVRDGKAPTGFEPVPPTLADAYRAMLEGTG